jgi:hypothetical protein
MRSQRLIVLSSLLLIAAAPAWGRVFLEWTEPAIPPPTRIGVRELVVSWTPGNVRLMTTAKSLGYSVFAGVRAADAATAANAAASSGLAGIIVESESGTPGSNSVRELLERLRRSYPRLAILELSSQGKQPQIRGNLVVSRDGVLVVSSPTEQPWIDSNVALARFVSALQPNKPPLFSFSWDLIDPLERQVGPRAADYALAVAEAGAMRADLILPVHPNLQKALADGNQAAWREWERVKTYLQFYSAGKLPAVRPCADIAVVADDYGEAYEAMNLMARHNILFTVFPPDEVTPQRMARLQMAVVFSRPDEQGLRTLQAFADQGGTVVLVQVQGHFPWETLPSIISDSGRTYTVGRGRVVELAEPIADPETFAEMVRNLMSSRGSLVRLWNALTILAFAFREPHTDRMELELVNYAEQAQSVQVRVKGLFSEVRYETPEHGNYPAIRPEHNDGYTEFVLPDLQIGGRVYLTSEAENTR